MQHHNPYLLLDPSSSSMSDYKRLPSKDDEDDSAPAEGFNFVSTFLLLLKMKFFVKYLLPKFLICFE